MSSTFDLCICHHDSRGSLTATMIMPLFFYYLIILACCCILLTIQISNNILLIPVIIAYGITTTLDMSETIRYKDRTICKHKSSLSFGIFVKH